MSSEPQEITEVFSAEGDTLRTEYEKYHSVSKMENRLSEARSECVRDISGGQYLGLGW